MNNYMDEIISRLGTYQFESVIFTRKDEMNILNEELSTSLLKNITESYEKFDVYLTIVKEKSVKKRILSRIKGVELFKYLQKYTKQAQAILVDVSGKKYLFGFIPNAS